ncbi:UDP-N-acetylglucosamine 2-epimerase (hydrolyzing) [Roseburia inulinivorans]|uniref:UDP-N-acetylglucosamine 2-epimerase n=1 Tax=Roseburia inulinivorans TaxID=360807 RepID=UPI000E4B8BCF|nr:UDP-N-acetylglucosamine 2-epimerase [Roseburia inulinivorans]RGS65531.1 UDP-N-acetylglucosamine 2-epimerase (hydrolyzing) [Roseburia inulinivorans]
MKRIGIMTGTRAEYGLLKSLMQEINKDNDLELYLIVSGMHLSPEFGMTYKEIEEDGFEINAKVEMLLSSDSPAGISKSIGLGVIGFADEFQRADLDMLILLGDRYEALSAAICALVMRIPIAHLHGGELTEGAIDEGIRHSITKMSYLHFTSTEQYRNRVIQLGENPERVFYVGALGVENIKKINLMTKEELERSIHFEIDENTVIVTYHPVTLENNTVEEQFLNLLEVLDRNPKIRMIFTKANADTNGRIVNELIDKYAAQNSERACAFVSLGQKRYLSALKYCRIVIGNSSSGIIEAPSFGKPIINIGDRQKGRICADSVINCGYTQQEIQQAMETALTEEFENKARNCRNPYEKENTAANIISVIKDYLLNDKIKLKKGFYDIK